MDDLRDHRRPRGLKSPRYEVGAGGVRRGARLTESVGDRHRIATRTYEEIR